MLSGWICLHGALD